MLMVAVLLLCSLAGAAVIGGAVDTTARARVQAVTDLVALGAAHGDAQGAAVARANAARIVSSKREGGVVTVTVELDGRRGIAAATLDVIEH